MDDPVLQIFRQEAREHLAALEKLFLDLEAAPDVDARRQLIDHLFRHAHSLKGDARVVGLDALKREAQLLEDLLDGLRVQPEHVDAASIDRGLAQFDVVRQVFENWRLTGPADAAATSSERAPSAENREPASNAAPPSLPATASKPAPAEVAARGGAAPDRGEAFTVRVASEKLDRMLNLVGELRVCQRSADGLATRLGALQTAVRALLKSCAAQSATENRQSLEAALDQLRQISGDLRKKRLREDSLAEALEQDVREARLLPLATLADTLRRATRELAQSLGKRIHLEADVGDVLLDKAVIEALLNPLLHLVRNAADHGIEAPQLRRAAGKNELGVITISAVQQGPRVRIRVSDDGRGVDFARVRAQALRRQGLTDAERAALADERSLAECLFMPGFSTAEAGEVSGRGVGLDAVRDVVRRLQGSVELVSSSPRGAVFMVDVPVSLSSIRVLTVSSGGQFFGVPTSVVLQTGRARLEDFRELDGVRVLPVDGRPVRWISLAQLLGVQEIHKPTGEPVWFYLLVKQQGREVAIAVSDMEEEAEILLKPLGFPLQGMPGVLGASVRADGSAQLVLDLASVDWAAIDGYSGSARFERQPIGRILVADDSPTTRAVLRNVLSAAGYAVTTAIDGVDALESLRSRPVDLVVSDVDMPRLGGFDLTRQIKAKYALPVILVTGKESEDHRLAGLAAGADAYVVKSTFEDQGLLEIVQQFL